MIIVIVAALILLAAAFCFWQNNAVDVDEYVVESPALPEELDGCRIVQLSDLHNKRYGEDQKRLIRLLEKAGPDLILVTGDLIDKRRTKEDRWGNALSLIRQAVELAPVFYVSGNHEWESGLYKELRPQLETLGAEILDDGFTVLDHGQASMAVLGVSDPAAFSKDVKQGRPMKKAELPACVDKVRERLEWLCGQQDETAFQVLIAHRPQLVGMYAAAGVHLVFSGHAHGGQVRLPRLGALYAPDQGWRPKYTEGPYIQGNTVMIVSRGLGNSSCPFRILDKPQIVVVTLRAPKEAEEELDEASIDPSEAGEEAAVDGEAAPMAEQPREPGEEREEPYMGMEEELDESEKSSREPEEEAAEPADSSEYDAGSIDGDDGEAVKQMSEEAFPMMAELPGEPDEESQETRV